MEREYFFHWFPINAMRILICIAGLTVVGNGFLLDGTQPPPTPGSLMTDEHYKFVMQFIFQERQSRLQLEEYMKQLQQQLSTTKSELVTQINELKRCGCADSIQNKTLDLEKKVEALQKDYTTVKQKNSQLQSELLLTKNKSVELISEVTNLKQLKSVSDLQVVLTLKNTTEHLEREIQETNNRQNAIVSDQNARKQDFQALYQKFQINENAIQTANTKLDNKTNIITKTFQKSFQVLEFALNSTNANVHALESELNSVKTNGHTLISELISVKANVHNNLASLQNINNRVFLSAWVPSEKTMSNAEVIPFTSVRAAHGISSSSSMRSRGVFTCEKSGYYLASFFVASKSSKAEAILYRNTAQIARTMKSGDGNYESHAAMAITQLNTGDILSVKAHVDAMNVYSTYDTGFTILQIY